MPSKLALNLSAHVAAFLKAKGWSEREFAGKSGGALSQRTINNVVNYRDDKDRHPGLNTIEAIAAVMGVEPIKLLEPDSSPESHLLRFDLEKLDAAIKAVKGSRRGFTVETVAEAYGLLTTPPKVEPITPTDLPPKGASIGVHRNGTVSRGDSGVVKDSGRKGRARPK